MFKVISINANVRGSCCLFFKLSFCYPNNIKTNVNLTQKSVELIKAIWKRRHVYMKKLVPLWLLELDALLKSSTSKYWEEFSQSDSLTASLSLSIMTFSMELLFLVKVLNVIVLPCIVEWKSLSFSAEKGYNFFEQVKQCHTVLSLINKLCLYINFVTLDVNPYTTVILLYSFMVFGNRIQADSTRKCSWHLFYSNLHFSQECLVVWLVKRKKSLDENFGKDLVELTVPSRKYLSFCCYVYRTMHAKRFV